VIGRRACGLAGSPTKEMLGPKVMIRLCRGLCVILGAFTFRLFVRGRSILITVPQELSLLRIGAFSAPTISLPAFVQQCGSSRATVDKWLTDGLILAYRASPSSNYRLDLDYVSKLRIHSGRWHTDRYFLELFCLCWNTRNGTSEQIRLAWSILEDAIVQGRLVDTAAARGQLGIFTKKGVAYWRNRGYLRYAMASNGAFPLRVRALYLASDIRALANQESQLTPAEVMERLGVGEDALKTLVHSGQLPCIRVRGGARRFRESDVVSYLAARFAVRRQYSLKRNEAAVRLGVRPGTLDYWRNADVVSAGKWGREWCFDPDEIETLRLELTTINRGFEWLQQPQRDCRREGVQWMNTKQVESCLGLSSSTVSSWIQLGYLPYYRSSPSKFETLRACDIPASYIAGFVRYLNGRPASLPAAEIYRAMCQEQKRIV